MATVYRATDQNLQRDVAVKVLAQSVATQPGFADRFLQEARLIARLRHPNIVQVYNFGEQDGLSYMVMELLPGPTLEQYLADMAAQGQQIGADEIQQIVEQIASALDAAHRAGIIHRDIKPSNVIRNAHGGLVLTDFGIAKAAAGGMNSQTQTGFVLGTPNYLSPEQARGMGNLTAASDVYALGVVLYEMLAGKPPFSGDTPMQVLIDHIQSPAPSLRQTRPELSPAVDAVVQRALAKDPAARFATAGALAQALAQAWNAPATAVAPVPPPATSVNNAATQVWNDAPNRQQAQQPRQPAPQPQIGQPRPAPVRPATSTVRPANVTQARPAPPPVPPTYESRRSSPFGGMLFLLLLLGIAGIGWVLWQSRGDFGTVVAPTPNLPAVTIEAPTVAAPPTPEPTAEPSAEPTPEPTPEPVVQPTPEPTPEPVVQPTPEPTPDVGDAPAVQNPLTALRDLIAQGQGAGALGGNGPAIIEAFNDFAREYNDGNRGQAQKALNDLQQLFREGRDNGEIQDTYATAVLDTIQRIADANGFNVRSDDDRRGNGKEKKNDD